MMKYFSFILLFAAVIFKVDARDIRGQVLNSEGQALVGAAINLRGQAIFVNTNETGKYILQEIADAGTLVVSFTGYETRTVDFSLADHELNIVLERKSIALEPVTVTTQRRPQRLLDVPATVSVVDALTLETTNTRELEFFADYVPGLNIRMQTPHRPNISIRGLTSDEVSPNAQPRVSVYFDNVPMSRASMAATELYDLERVEVAKGPQNTLFAYGSQIGAVNFISRKPNNNFEGYFSAGAGNYSMKEFEGALNFAPVKDKFAMRIAGVYSGRDGYVKNLSGDALNGKNTVGARFSARFTPVEALKIDLSVNYQNDDTPGTAFMSRRYPNSKGVKDIFKYEASLDEGKKWLNHREILGGSLNVRYFVSENSWINSTTSYYTNFVDHRWDGDGTVAPAIDMSERDRVRQFAQDLRYNFSAGSRLDGFFGMSYRRENVSQRYWFGGDEQYAAYLLFQMFDYMIMPDGSLAPAMPAIPDLGDPRMAPLTGMPLPSNHEEESLSGAVNQTGDMFADATLRLLPRLSLTAGMRISAESFKVSNEAQMLGVVPSALGFVTQAYPNFFFAPRPYSEFQRDFISFTWRASLKYDIGTNSSAWAGYSRGRRPNVLQYDSKGQSEILNAENVHSYEAGLKWNALQRYWFDAGVFYQLYNNFQTSKWVDADYLVADAGKATSYGIEFSAKAVLCNYFDIFGNYAWIHARFDDNDSEGSKQEYAGKTFRLTPEHSLLIGANAKWQLSNRFHLIFTPTWSWRSHIWFEDANELQPTNPALDRLDQNAYGLLNLNLAFKMLNPRLTLSIFAANLTDTKYVIGAGNTGTMFGVPTYVPGLPRMFGAKLKYDF
ncbi:MAG: TonB-dependent receptor [Prevotellaceae bacterium]|jgi:outer membrane receptor protein involved in Fe transport|nr:TonB-dependent receptor [Prevotellaceae bacterium]